MQGSFEKNVQKKMDGLRLSPSAAVWEKVEVEIAAERKKRRGIFWLPLAGLLLVGGGWWGYRSLTKEAQTMTATAERKSVETSVAKQPSVNTPSVTGKGNAENATVQITDNGERVPAQQSTSLLNTEKKESTPHRTEVKMPDNRTAAPVAQTASPLHSNNKPSTKKPLVVDNATQPAKAPANRPVATAEDKTVLPGNQGVPVPIAGQNSSVANTSVPVSTNKNDKAVSVTDAQLKQNDSISSPQAEKTLPQATDTAVAKTDSVLKKKVAKGKNWRKEIGLAIGMSSYATGGIFGGMGMADALNFNSGAGVNAPPNQSARSAPSATKGGLAFSIGYLLSKPVSKKFEFAFGLQYAYASTRIKIGDKKAVDTLVNFNMDKAAAEGYYTNTGKKDYINAFHSVELPVRITYQPSVKLPLHITVGLAYGYLVYTNALTFSATSNLYYRNSDNYKRHQVPLSAAVQWRFRLGKNKTLQAGPVAQYNLVRVNNENSTNPPHFFFAGLRTALQL